MNGRRRGPAYTQRLQRTRASGLVVVLTAVFWSVGCSVDAWPLIVVPRVELSLPEPAHPQRLHRHDVAEIAIGAAEYHGYRAVQVKEIKWGDDDWKVKLRGRLHGHKAELKVWVDGYSGEIVRFKEKHHKRRHGHHDYDDHH